MLWANCAKIRHGKEKKFWYQTMVTCYGFRLLFTIVLTKALHKLLPKKLVHSLSFSEWRNQLHFSFVVLIILNALKKLTY